MAHLQSGLAPTLGGPAYPVGSRLPQPVTYAVESRAGARKLYGTGAPSFTIVASDIFDAEAVLDADTYSAAMAFINGKIEIRGNLLAALRFKLSHNAGGWHEWLSGALARLPLLHPSVWFQSRNRAAQAIRFHYDRSNGFYSLFLDSRMVYSCAYFKDPSWSLEQAQLAKLDYILKKLDIRPGDRFLDIGCGWGALVIHAAERYGACSTGCTLSRRQFDLARQHAAEHGLQNRVRIHEMDYRELDGQFDKIASIGMFEHVGRRRLRGYFEKVASLLNNDGLFLNHGIVRPQGVRMNAGSLLWQRRVFPGADLVHLADVIHAAERARFEVLDVENLRLHYALTTRAWATRLQENEAKCLRAVDTATYRTWLLFLAASSLSFEDGLTDVCQVVLAKRSSPYTRRLTRDHMTIGSSGRGIR